MEGLLDKWVFPVNQRKLLQWVRIRPDSTAVNSWAINVMKERVLVESKIKEKHTEIGNYKNNFSDFWVTSQISIKDLSK
jgi:hypothetical protein